jgi:fructose-1,6-bisphosphatase
MNKITFTKVSNRNKFIIALREMYLSYNVHKPLKDCVDIYNDISTRPFCIEDCVHSADDLYELFGDCADYKLARMPATYACHPPWETQEYINAEEWYKTLPEEDRKKIDILVKANIPWG